MIYGKHKNDYIRHSPPIFDALSPERLTTKAQRTIDKAEHQNELFCCDISLWEIAMLIQKKSIDPGIEAPIFLELVLNARRIQVLAINVEIACISSNTSIFSNTDPANRLIAATTIHYHAKLISSDKKLMKIPQLEIIW